MPNWPTEAGRLRTKSKTEALNLDDVSHEPRFASDFVFAPEERDVYSYSPTPKDLAPLGARPGGEIFAEPGKEVALPRSVGSIKSLPGYKHLAPPGRSANETDQTLRRFSAP